MPPRTPAAAVVYAERPAPCGAPPWSGACQRDPALPDMCGVLDQIPPELNPNHDHSSAVGAKCKHLMPKLADLFSRLQSSRSISPCEF